MSGNHTHSSRLCTSGRANGGGEGEDEDDRGHVANLGSKAATQMVGRGTSAAIWTGVPFLQSVTLPLRTV